MYCNILAHTIHEKVYVDKNSVSAMNLVADVDDAVKETKRKVLTIVCPATNTNTQLLSISGCHSYVHERKRPDSYVASVYLKRNKRII